MVAQIRPPTAGVQNLRSEDPAISRREGQEIMSAARNISGAADQAMGYFKDLEQNQASADFSRDYSEWYTAATEKPVITTQEALDMGAPDGPHLWDEDDEGAIIERDDVNLWEVLPDAAKDRYQKLTDRYGKKISGHGAQQKWVNDANLRGEQMYAKMKMTQADEYFNNAVSKHEMAIETAHKSGNPGMAVALAETHPDPAMRDQAVLDSVRRAETDSYHQALQSGDPLAMQEAADALRDSDTLSNLNESQQTAWIQQLENGAKQASAEGGAKRSFIMEQSLAAIESAVKTGDAGYADVLDYANWLYETGSEDLVPKTWLSTQKKAIDSFQSTKLDHTNRLNSVYRTMGGMTMMDLKDSKDIAAINEVADSFAAQGDIESLFRVTATTRHIPDVMRLSLNSALNAANDVEGVSDAAAIYNKLRLEASGLIDSLPQETQVFLERVYSQSRGGMITEDSIQAIRDEMRTTDPTEMKTRQGNYNLHSSSGQMKAKFEETFNGDRRYQSFMQRWSPFGSPKTPVSDQMYADFSRFVEDAVISGMPIDEAEEYGYGRVSAQYTVSEVNGVPEIMRDSPEEKYGLTPEQVNMDKDRQLKKDFDIPTSEASNYILRPTPSTQFQSNPAYQIFKEDDFGLLQPQRDQYGQYVTWKPDIEGLRKDQHEAQLKKAKQDRRAAKIKEDSNIYRNVGKSGGGAPQDMSLSLEERIREDEGFKNHSYTDTEGHLTGGTGHKLTPAEAKKYPHGTVIPDSVTDRWLKEDLNAAKRGADTLFSEHGIEPSEENREIITNMVFQMGTDGVRKFKNMWKSMKEGDTAGVKREMKNSKWYGQTTSRADRLIERMNMG